MEQKQIDWNAIREEYIRDEKASYRNLAKKYGVSKETLSQRAMKEKWVELRKQTYDRMITKTVSKLSSAQTKRTSAFMTVADEALKKLRKALKMCSESNTQGLRHIVSSLKDIGEMQNIKSDADSREQEARIRNLEKQTEQDNIAPTITVIFDGNVEEYTK